MNSYNIFKSSFVYQDLFQRKHEKEKERDAKTTWAHHTYSFDVRVTFWIWTLLVHAERRKKSVFRQHSSIDDWNYCSSCWCSAWFVGGWRRSDRLSIERVEVSKQLNEHLFGRYEAFCQNGKNVHSNYLLFDDAMCVCRRFRVLCLSFVRCLFFSLSLSINSKERSNRRIY